MLQANPTSITRTWLFTLALGALLCLTINNSSHAKPPNQRLHPQFHKLIQLEKNCSATSAQQHTTTKHETPKAKAQYQSLLLEVIINDQPTQYSVIVLKRPCGALLMDINDLAYLRIHTHKQPFINIDDIYYVNLDAFTGLNYVIDLKAQQLLITAQAFLFASIEVDYDPQYKTTDPSATGAFINYGLGASYAEFIENTSSNITPIETDTETDLSASASDITNARSKSYTAAVAAGIFSPYGTLNSQWFAVKIEKNNRQNANGNQALEDIYRQKTTFTKTFDKKTTALRIGDVNSNGSNSGFSYTMGGVQYGTDIRGQLGYQFAPVENLKAFNSQPTQTVLTHYENPLFGDHENEDAEIQGQFGQGSAYPVGPLEYLNLPLYNNGTYTLSSRYKDGSINETSVRYYYNAGLLRAGRHKYNIAAGWLRPNSLKDKYTDFIIAATDQYGFNNYFTGEVSAAYSQKNIEYGATGLFAIPHAGVSRVTIGTTHKINHGPSAKASYIAFGLNNRRTHYSYSLQYRYLGANSHSLTSLNNTTENSLRDTFSASISAQVRQRDQLSLSYRNTNSRRVNTIDTNGITTSSRKTPYNDSFALQYNLALPYSFNVNLGAQWQWHPHTEWFARLGFHLDFLSIQRLAGIRSSRHAHEGDLFSWDGTDINYTMAKGSNRELSGSVSISTHANTDLSSYGATISHSLFDRHTTRINLDYGNQYLNSVLSAQYDPDTERTSYNASVAGSLVFIDSSLFVSRPIGNSFGVIDLGEDAANVRVNGYYTDDNGKAFIPNFQPFTDNAITINSKDLPLTAKVETLDHKIRPGLNSGVVFKTKVQYTSDALAAFQIKNKAGQLVSLPHSAKVTIDQRKDIAAVGDNGLVYLTNITESSTVTIRYKTLRCTIILNAEIDKDEDSYLELGPYICERQTK